MNFDNTCVRIDLDAIDANIDAIRQRVGVDVMAIIKADAYGHGAIQVARLLQDKCSFFGVSSMLEAMELRRAGIYNPILILGHTPLSAFRTAIEAEIRPTIYTYDAALALSHEAQRSGKTAAFHFAVDTGMSRLGFQATEEDAEICARIASLPGLYAEGIFTHFATADEGEGGEAYTRAQFSLFTQAIDRLAEVGITFPIRHCANSAAIFDYPESHLDMVRAGIVLYGLPPSERLRNHPNLHPVMSLRSVISHVKTVQPDETVSYGRTYAAPAARQIATVPIGYADGFSRSLGQAGYCLCVGDTAAPIVGRVCMDQLMLDVTDIDCHVGDEILVFGEIPPFTAARVATLSNTINYEVVCDVGKRVPRVFVRGGEIIEWKDDILEDIHP